MTPAKALIYVIVPLLLWAGGSGAQTITVVEPFAGSVESSTHFSEFDTVAILVDDGEGYAMRAVEGEVRKAILIRPEDKSVLEVARSFETALAASGFDILFSRPLQRSPGPGQGNPSWVRDLEDVNLREFTRADGSPEERNLLARVYSPAQYYLSAERVRGTEALTFALTIGRTRDVYLMEQVTRVAMEPGTVMLSEDSLTRGIETEGRAILYGVQFDVGSAVLRPSSLASVETIANVLRERGGNFYVVGHTSDTGGFELNMDLSRARAASIIDVLGRDYGIDTSRLTPIGVGPAAPLASNQNEEGRRLNRRVELVERLEN